MPARKNTKNKTRGDLSGPEESSRASIAAPEIGYEARGVSSAFPGDAGSRRKHASVPEHPGEDEPDADLILTFLAYDRLLERALVRAGFVRASSSYRQAQPDWYSWSRHIEKRFDPDSSEELQGAVAHLVCLREEMDALPGRLQYRIQWESAGLYSDNLWLAEMIQQTRLQLTNRYHFAEISGCDTAQVMAALLLVEAWLQLVPGD